MSGMNPQITNIDNRPWYKKPIGIAGIVGGVVLVAGIASATGGGDASEAKDDNSASTSQAPASDGDGSSDKSTNKDTKEPAPSTWETVATLSGNTNKSGSDFHLEGCDTRLKYDVDGGSSTLVAFYVMESGTKLMEDGGFPVASPTESGPGETQLRNDEGDYYIEVVGANASWSAKVQEKC